MREIKFRAYLEKCQEMVEVIMIDFNEKYIAHEDLSFQSSESFEPVEPECVTDFNSLKLMQYTGLKDCNDKEIYEGDIVKCIYEIPAEPYSGEEEKIEVVIFDTEEAAFKFEGSDYEMYWPIKKEIIGNIHENPELLEENTHE